MMALNTSQIRAIDVTEKVGSVLSVLGAAFVIITFLSSSKFRKPINRLVFYASWGNILTNVATLIGTSAISLGSNAPLCQFQAFMIQWFMPADALWTFAMACNVYLSFFHHFDAPKLRALELKYVMFCYGVPFIPAFTYFFVNAERGPIYGDAVVRLWCWISIKWDFLRVAVFYGPVWVVILLTMAIYLRVGQLIWRWRRQLDSLGRHSDSGFQRSLQQATPVHGIRRTDEVTITSESVDKPEPVHSLPTFRPDASPPRRLSLHKKTVFVAHHSNNAARGYTYKDASRHANKATLKYCKCALLFFAALLCTWVPSSVNRIYTLIYPEQVPFGPEYAAGLVLPLQGFWNCVVYITTSLFACRCLWRDLRQSLERRRPSATSTICISFKQSERSLKSQHSRKTPESDMASLRHDTDRIGMVSSSPMSEDQY